MAEYVKVMKDYSKMCKTYLSKGKCSECPLYSKNNRKFFDCGEFTEKYPEEAEQIIEDWADKNPVMTNGMMFEKVFGRVDDLLFDGLIKYSWWNAEYHAPERSKNDA